MKKFTYIFCGNLGTKKNVIHSLHLVRMQWLDVLHACQPMRATSHSTTVIFLHGIEHTIFFYSHKVIISSTYSESMWFWTQSLSLWMTHWIIRSTDFSKNTNSFLNIIIVCWLILLCFVWTYFTLQSKNRHGVRHWCV